MCHPAILLHRAKADLTLLDENRNTALHLACSKVHTHTITQRILKSKLSINTVPTEYSSSLISNAFSFCFVPQAHEMCALLILGEIHSPTLINATNSALQM